MAAAERQQTIVPFSSQHPDVEIQDQGAVHVTHNENHPKIPHSRLQSRNYALFPRPQAQRDQVIDRSILDSILLLFQSRKATFSQDPFEEFLRAENEVTLADVYRILSKEPARLFAKALWVKNFVPSQDSSVQLDFDLSSILQNGSHTCSDLFKLASEAIKIHGDDAFKLCSISKAPSDINRVFSYFRLFTLSAHSDSQFWGRTLLAFLLQYNGQISSEFADTIIKSSQIKARCYVPRVYRLPSQGPLQRDEGSSFACQWIRHTPDFGAVSNHMR